MTEQNRERFKRQLSSAIADSVKRIEVPETLREKLTERLQNVEKPELPGGLTERALADFEARLAEAVHRSQEWAPEDRVVLRIESALSVERKELAFSERSVSAFLEGNAVPDKLQNVTVPEGKVNFFRGFRGEVQRAVVSRKAPESVKSRIRAALEKENSPAQIIPFPNKAQWKRGLSALTSLAAGFAILVFTLFGSADVALANSVRADHKKCCRMSGALQKNGPPVKLTEMMESKFGAVPVPPLESGWLLKVSRVCHTEDGKEMVHLLYTRPTESGDLESLSLHFIPDRGREKEKLTLEDGRVQEIGSGSFPVIAWLEGDWVCTASSSDMTSQSLQEVTAGGL
jgi:hypothetical protein